MKEMTDDQLILFLVLCLAEVVPKWERYGILELDYIVDNYAAYKRPCITMVPLAKLYNFLERKAGISDANQQKLIISLLNDRKVSARFYELTRYDHVYQITKQTLHLTKLTRKMTDADTIKAQLKAMLNERQVT